MKSTWYAVAMVAALSGCIDMGLQNLYACQVSCDDPIFGPRTFTTGNSCAGNASDASFECFVGSGCGLTVGTCPFGCTCGAELLDPLSCTGPCSPGILSNREATFRIAIDDDPVSGSFINLSQGGVPMGMIIPSGDIFINGGDCAGSSCPIEIRGIEIRSDETPTLADGRVLGHMRLYSRSMPDDTISPTGAFVLAPGALQFSASADVDLARQVVAFGNTNPATIHFDATTGQFEAIFTLEDAFGGRAGVNLFGTVVSEAPVADAGADFTGDCTGAVTLDGTSSTDPDNDIVFFRWFTGYGSATPVLLGSGETLETTLSLGTTVVTLEVFDARGVRDTDDVSVVVADTAGPDIEVVSVTPDCLWPPNHGLVRLDLGVDLVATATDACDGSSGTVRIVSVSSNELDDAIGDGETDRDARFSDSAVCLRSERSGTLDGRTYTIVLEASDSAGNTSQDTVEVTVPHDSRRSTRCEALPADRLLAEGDPLCDLPNTGTSSPPATCSVAVGHRDAGWSVLAVGLGLIAAARRSRRRHD